MISKKRLLVQVTLLLIGSLALALVGNGLRRDGIPVLRPSKEDLALKSGITPIHLDTAKLLMQNPKVLFLDARPFNVWKRGRSPGAPLSMPPAASAAR